MTPEQNLTGLPRGPGRLWWVIAGLSGSHQFTDSESVALSKLTIFDFTMAGVARWARR